MERVLLLYYIMRDKTKDDLHSNVSKWAEARSFLIEAAGSASEASSRRVGGPSPKMQGVL